MDLNNRISNTNGRDERARALGQVYRFLLSLPLSNKNTDAGLDLDGEKPAPVGDAPSSNEMEQDDDNTPAAARSNSGDLNFNGVNDA
jgi:hypothetical protein